MNPSTPTSSENSTRTSTREATDSPKPTASSKISINHGEGFSTFKRLFGEHSTARNLANIARELMAKVALYNMLVSLREGAGRSDDGERLSYSRPKLIHKAQVKTKEDEKGRSIASAGRRSKVTYKEGRVYQIKLSWFNKTEVRV